MMRNHLVHFSNDFPLIKIIDNKAPTNINQNTVRLLYFFTTTLDGAVPLTAAGLAQSNAGSIPEKEARWYQAAVLPGPGQGGATGLCRQNQDRTGNGQELASHKAIWFSKGVS